MPGWPSWPRRMLPRWGPGSGRGACGAWRRPTRWRPWRGPRCWARSAAGQDYVDDGDYSPVLVAGVHRTQVTGGTAGDHTGWVKRGAGHPAVMAALADRGGLEVLCAGDLPVDRTSCPRTPGRRPMRSCSARRRRGWSWRTWPGWPAEMYEKSRQDKPDTDGEAMATDGDPGDGFDDRAVKLATTIGGAGVIHGDLSPSARSSCRRCWMRCPPRPARMMTAPMSSGITTLSRRRCGGCSPPGCCRSGPGSR